MAKKYPYARATSEADLLRLACLKENFEYIDFWEKKGGEKVERAFKEIQNFYDAGGTTATICEDCGQQIETVTYFDCGLNKFGVRRSTLPADDVKIMKILDPFLKDMPERKDIPKRLPFNFVNPLSVFGVETANGVSHVESGGVTLEYALRMKPSERLLKADLSRKRAELIDDFKRFIDAVDYFRNDTEINGGINSENYSKWEPDQTRFRKEAWQQIEVWKLRKEKKTFAEIARRLDISEDAAKQRFYKAYERTQEKKYDQEKYNKIAYIVRKDEMKNICETCPHRQTCCELCPDALRFIDQDHIKMKELIFSDGLNEKLI